MKLAKFQSLSSEILLINTDLIEAVIVSPGSDKNRVSIATTKGIYRVLGTLEEVQSKLEGRGSR